MATTSPSPNSSPSAVPPVSNTTSSTPPPQPNVGSPESSNSTTQSPPPDVPSAPPPTVSSPPPPLEPTPSPPVNKQSDPPASSPPPPSSSNVPPPTSNSPPPPVSDPPKSSPSPPPPVSDPPSSSTPPPQPVSSPPPPTLSPPKSSPPPPTLSPPKSSPPPPSTPPKSSPPPPAEPPKSSPPPQTSPPPPPTKPPEKSPPPPATDPPKSSPPSPPTVPPKSSPPPPKSEPPKSSPPPPASTPPKGSPPPPASEPPSSAPPPSNPNPHPPPSSQPTPSAPPPKSSAPPPRVLFSPPPPSDDAPPPTTQIPSPPSNVPNSTNSNPTVSPSSNATTPTSNKGIGTGGAVAISVVAGIIVLSFIAFAVWCMRRKQRKKVSGFGGYVMPSPMASSTRSDTSSFLKTHSSAPLIGSGSGSDSHSPAEPAGSNSRPWFTYDELVKATNGFSSQNLLGEGGFGSVYKGVLPDDREVAVKQLKIGGSQGEREFKAEVETISRVHHRHLVSLVGYCISENQRLLVYEYVSNDTLYFHLHGEGRPVLDWATRVKIAAGAARGIAYLHEDCHPRIIHRDIKSSNILLDNNFEARVSDFGLAKLCLDANTHISTRVMGTFGYVAPEYASSGKLTEKSDVYSYGVVLLELITGRKAVDASQPLGDESLVEWARPLLGYALDNEEFEGLVDPRLEKNYVESEVFRLIEIAAACVRHSSAKRPRMGQVVRAFDSMATADLTNGMKVGESETFNSAQQSAEIRLFQRMAFGSQNYSTDFFSEGSRDSHMV